MKLPQYLENKKSVIILNEDKIINNSQYEIKENTIILDKDTEVFLLVADYNNEEIKIQVKEDSNIVLYTIFKSSMSTEYNLVINLEKNSKLDLFTSIRNHEVISLKVNRIFNQAMNSILNVNNALINIGETKINDAVNLNEEFATVNFEQLNIGSYKDIFEVNQDIKHLAKSTTSQITNSLISNLSSKLKYSVSGYIFKGNELSSCNQINKGIILSDFGEIEVEPKLFIDEYNVEASHGAAIGQVDEEQLYYLLSRGLTEMDARSLIISGYTKPFVNNIPDEDIRQMIERQILKKINEVNIL